LLFILFFFISKVVSVPNKLNSKYKTTLLQLVSSEFKSACPKVTFFQVILTILGAYIQLFTSGAYIGFYQPSAQLQSRMHKKYHFSYVLNYGINRPLNIRFGGLTISKEKLKLQILILG